MMRDPDLFFDPQNVNLSRLATLPLSSRRQFPEISCVYLAIDSLETVQYVGQSVNLKRRWVNHHRCRHLEEMGSIRIAWIENSYGWMLNEMESSLIKWFNPPLNGLVAHRAETVHQSTSCIRWNLRVLMARHNIKGLDLAKELGMTPNAICALRRDKMPRMDGDSLTSLCIALRKLSGGKMIGIDELIEFVHKEPEN